MPRAGIALGSNLGDRIARLRDAFVRLREIATPEEPVLTAPIYQTEPRFCPPGSPSFYNTVIEIAFDGGALDLLEKTRSIERQLGRLPTAERNAPRVIDIDLLYLGDECRHHGELVLPHPRLGERRFVLQPLSDIRPELVLPGQTQSIAEMLGALQTDEPPLVPVPQRILNP